MTHSRVSAVPFLATLGFLLLVGTPSLYARQASADDSIIVPTLVQFSGVLSNSGGKPLTSIMGVTFSLYAEQAGGAALWMETQNVQPDASGHYSVMLGSTTSRGLPSNLFASGVARWLGVQVQGQEEQPAGDAAERALCFESRGRTNHWRTSAVSIRTVDCRYWCGGRRFEPTSNRSGRIFKSDTGNHGLGYAELHPDLDEQHEVGQLYHF
jgi:hypothetical protein